MKQLSIFILFLVLFVSPQHTVQATSGEIFHEDFTQPGVMWSEEISYQHDNPTEPCRGPTDNPRWKRTSNGMEIFISGSVPCVSVLPLPLASVPSEEIELVWRWYISDPVQDRNIAISFIDSANYFNLHFFDKQLTPGFVKDGDPYAWNIIDQKQLPFSADHEYEIRTRFSKQSRKLLVWVNSVLVLEAELQSDNTIPFRPALMASVGTGVNTSYSVFRSLSVFPRTQPLTFPLWKQNHPYWSNNTYDSAQEWSKEAITIARWGCALTSAANLLAHYGIQQTPDGSPLNPGTLNAWLQEQSDGYLGPGLLNWRAITRLAKWHSQEFNTPALELTAEKPSSEDKIGWLQEKLFHRIPIILEQPNHFVLAIGNSLENVINIHDPLFETTTLQDYDHSYLSARVFTPSYTDLQGGIFLTPSWMTPKFIDQNNQELKRVPLETISGDWNAWDIGRWGTSQLQIVSDSPITALVTGWMYSEDGVAHRVNTLVPAQETVSLSAQQHLYTPVSDRDFSYLLAWKKIKSPVIWEWHQEVKDSLSVDDIQDKTTIHNHYSWLLQVATDHEWLNHATKTMLIQDIKNLTYDQTIL